MHPSTTRAPPPDAHALLITETGFIPLRLSGSGSVLNTFESVYGAAALRAGRLHPDDLREHLTSAATSHSRHANIPRLTGTDSSNSSFVTSYCGKFSSSLQACRCYLRGDSFTVLQAGAPLTAEGLSGDAVTLIAVGWAIDFADRRFDALLDGWEGPKVSLWPVWTTYASVILL